MKSLFPLLLSTFLMSPCVAQPQAECPNRDSQVCLDRNSELIIALGIMRSEPNSPKIYLEGDPRGTMRLVLSPTLQEFVKESPAESYEAEGYLTQGKSERILVVTNLRPIE